jgi:hypothetical protein
MWEEERYKAFYVSHLNSLGNFNNYSPGDLTQIQDELLENARSVPSPSIINLLR